MYGYYRKKLQGNHFWQFKGSDLKASPMIHNLQESNVNMYIRNKNKTALQLRTAFFLFVIIKWNLNVSPFCI